jgi:hydrogenase maturation factor
MSAPSRDELTKSYQKTMTTMQTELNGFDRFLSRLFHTQLISSILSLLGRSVLQIRALLIGSAASFVTLVFFYLYAKFDGYAITGFEPLLAFLAGWVIGLALDIFSKK